MGMLDLGSPSRRSILKGGGALVVSFSLLPGALAQEVTTDNQTASPEPVKPEPLPGSLDTNRLLDAWIRIDAEGSVTVFTGKAELGQGVKTALIQVAAEELEVKPEEIRLVTADTDRTPDEGYTAGSQSMQNSGTAIRNAAAQVRELLIGIAAQRFSIPADKLRADNKSIVAPDGQKAGYGELVAGDVLHVEAQPKSKLKDPGTFRVMGQAMQRVDIPAKVTGGPAYVQDLRMADMVHARVVRPPSPGARLVSVDEAAVAAMPGVVKVVREGEFLAVVAEREFEAIKAMRRLAVAGVWKEQPTLPDINDLPAVLQSLEREVGTVAESHNAPDAVAAKTLEATFTRPYQIHGSIGPSCAVGLMDGGHLTVWSHTQGVYPDRKAICEMLAMPPEQVRVIHAEGSGCYGHNGADDAAGDAALIARALPGRPVRVQWHREQEHSWEPYGPAMLTKVKASLDAGGRIVDWQYDLWSNNHGSRPGPAGALLGARSLDPPFPPEQQKLAINPNGNGDRNADPLYAIPNRKVLWHFLPDMPLRASALRALGAYSNVFSIESFMDELANEASQDPVEFRLKHLTDPRARDVVTEAATRFGWSTAALPDGRGRGFAFARYKNHASYLALALEMEVERETGRARVVRVVAAIDSGEIVNPDGIKNQTEGGIIQSISWTLFEAVQFDRTRVHTIDWASYPILRFDSVPDSIEVHVIPRPGEPFLGAGEAAQGPTSAAVGNALRSATGKRLYDLPLTRERIKAAIGV